MYMFKRILFPTSGSPLTTKIAEMICDLVKENPEREVMILTVAAVPELPANITMMLEQAGIHANEVVLQDIKDRIAHVTSIFEKHDVPYQVKVSTGEPLKSIIKEAEDFDADLLVVGNHGQSSLADFLFKGNVTVQLINETKCPVLVVK